MSYTFSGVATDASATTTSTVTLSVGAAVGSFVVVAIEQQNGHANPTLTIGGVSLNLDVIDGNNTTAIFSGKVPGLSGNQSVALTATGSAFETRSFSLWYTTDNVSLSHTASVPLTANNFNIAVLAGDFLFVMGENGAATDYNGSTAAPAANHATGGSGNNTSADWTISSTNAAFNVKTTAAGNMNAVGATYAAIIGVGALFGVIGLASNEY
jgi:hypothetical protein